MGGEGVVGWGGGGGEGSGKPDHLERCPNTSRKIVIIFYQSHNIRDIDALPYPRDG